MDSSDSEEENLDTFREAIDTQFINDSMFQKSKPKDEEKKIEVVEPKLPSLRKNICEEDDSLNYFKLSKGFQTFVAKKLSEKLDRELKELLMSNLTPVRFLGKPKGGIRLLKTSEKYLKVSKVKTDFVERKEVEVKEDLKVVAKEVFVEECQEGFRRNFDEEDESCEVPEELQSEIVKFLFELLEERIKLKKFPEGEVKNVDELNGIKLFKTSNLYLKDLDCEEKVVKMPRKRCNLETDEDLETRCKSVAVETDEILSKNEVKSWSNRSKAPVFNYRRKKGKYVLVEPKFVSIKY